MNRRGFLGLMAGSFAAPIGLGLKDLIPVGITNKGVRPVGDLPVHKIRWTKPMGVPDQDVHVTRGFLDVEHDCACGFHASGMYVNIVVTGNEREKNKGREAFDNLLRVKESSAILKLEDLWETAKNDPFIVHATCPKVVGAWRYSA